MRLTNFDCHNNYYVPQKNFVLNVTIDDYYYGNVIEKLGQYEDVDESPEHLAKIKKALEILKDVLNVERFIFDMARNQKEYDLLKEVLL